MHSPASFIFLLAQGEIHFPAPLASRQDHVTHSGSKLWLTKTSSSSGATLEGGRIAVRKEPRMTN